MNRNVWRMIIVKKIFLLILLSLFIVVFTAGCGKQTFNGNRTSNDTQFIMDYTILNKTVTHEMKLEEGAIINVSIVNESGILKILVADTEGQEIYRGDKADTSEFKLEIQKAGTYKFTVTGSKAKGSISFKVAE